MDRYGRKLRRAVRTLLRTKGLNACDVTIHWRNLTSKPVGYDPEIKPLSNPGTIVENDGEEDPVTIRGFVHYVTPATNGFQRFQEIQQGDVILDIDAETDLSGKDDLRFEIDGVQYVQKDHGRELAQAWDVRFGDVAILRTLLLRPQQ